MRRSRFLTIVAVLMLTSGAVSDAQQPSTFDNNTRVMAIGDSITAGYGAVPMTGGYAYLLYEQGIYDSMTNTTFVNAAVPDSTSEHVLQFQVPSATQIFFPDVIVMTVGGNDLLSILKQGADPQDVLTDFQNNLSAIFLQLCTQLPQTRIYVGNLYSIDNFVVPTEQIIGAFNQVVDGVSDWVNAAVCGGRVRVADVHSAFAGSQQGLLLFNRPGSHPAEPHPTNAGHHAIARAFIAAK